MLTADAEGCPRQLVCCRGLLFQARRNHPTAEDTSMMREVALLTTSAGDGLATVVDVLTGTHLTTLKNCSAQPGSTALIAGDFVVSAQVKGTAVHFWAWGTEQPRLKCHAPEKLGPLAVSGDGWLCAGGGASGRIYLWEVSSGTLLRAWDAHYKAVSALTFGPSGSFLYSGGEDAMVSSWNMLAAVNPEESEAFKGSGGGGGGRSSLPATWTASEHSLPVTCLHAAKGGGRLYSCSLDRSAKAWDACSGRLLLSVACPAFLRTVTTDPAEAFLFAAGGGGVIFQLDISATAIAATASDAAVASSGGFFEEDLEDEEHDSSWGLRLPEGRRRGGGGNGGSGGGSGLQELHGHEKAVTSLSVTADSSVLVSASEDGTARSWHVASRQCVHKTEGVCGKGGGAVSQVLLLPLPEALMIVRAAAGGGGGGGGGGRKRQSLPLAPFDKFMRSSSGKSKIGDATGFDFSVGCTPVVLKGTYSPRGRLGGVRSRGVGASATASATATTGIRAALEALEGRGAGLLHP
ncbi:unnamed protein product, partial [Pylaiella littoralis]